MANVRLEGRRVWTVTVLSAILLAGCLVGLPLIGPAKVSFAAAFAGHAPDAQILFGLRVPRVLLAALAGGALALSGLLFQALLRNGLAEPYTLGVSGGASLGAVAAIALQLPGVWAFAILGAGLTILLVLRLAQTQSIVSPFTLLMAGVTMNSISSAMILFLHSSATFGQSVAITRWLMGGVESVESGPLIALCALVVPAVVLVFLQARAWNLLAIGEDWASIRGVATGRLTLTGYLVGSVLTGSVTSLTGPIGFVGLIVPHALRMRLGADHRLLIPSSFLLGGAFLALCDSVARTAIPPTEIPVGVITSMLGGPFFIWLLRKQQTR